MADEYGPTFITVTDEDGREIVLEFVDALEYNGQQYQAFFPAETEGEDEDDPDNGLVILKVLHEDGRICCPRWIPTRNWTRSMTCSWSPCSTRTESPDTPYKNFSPGPLVSSCIPGRDVIR